MLSANSKLQSGRPPMDADDRVVSIYSATSTASSANQSLSDDFTGVRAFSIFSVDILNKKAHQLVGHCETRHRSSHSDCRIIFAVTCSENVHALPYIESNWLVHRDNNTTEVIYVNA